MNVNTGSVGIGTTDPQESAILEVNSTVKGFLPPCMTSEQMMAISNPSEGLTVYNYNFKTLCFFDGTMWAHNLNGKSCGVIQYNGQVYQTVVIGLQCWMGENLNIGAMINSSSEQTNNDIIEKYCYDNNTSNCDTFGGLYQWDEVMQYVTTQGAQGICPDDWHIPTDDEWKILEGIVDSQYPVGDPEWNGTTWRGFDAGYHLKSTLGWNSSGNGDDSFRFKALPGGYRHGNGDFYYLGDYAYLWSSAEAISSATWYRRLSYDIDEVYRFYILKPVGVSVRCLRDD